MRPIMPTTSPLSGPTANPSFPSHLPADTPFRLVDGIVRHECSEEEVDRLIQLHQREPLNHSNTPSWLTLLESGDAYTIPLVDGSHAVKVLYLHRSHLSRFASDHFTSLFDRVCRHLHRTTDCPGFLKYRQELSSNRDWAGTAFTTSFTRANSFLVAPVAHSHHSSEKDEESSVARRVWLQQFNALVGDLSGALYRSILAPAYCDMLECRAEVTNPPCPGSSFQSNRFITSIQINCSHPDRQVSGTAGATHRDQHDDPLSFSVAFNASVIRSSTRLGHFLFPGLGCAAPLQAGGIILFSGVDLHRGMPIVVDARDQSVVPLGFAQETRLQVIAYPSFPILNGRMERSMPTTQEAHERRNPTTYNLVEHSLAAFGSNDARDRWNERESVRELVNNLQLHHGRTDALDLPAFYRTLFPHAPPPTYQHLHVSGQRLGRDGLRVQMDQRLMTLNRTFHSCRFHRRLDDDQTSRKRQKQQDVNQPTQDDDDDATEDELVDDSLDRMAPPMGSDMITRQGLPVDARIVSQANGRTPPKLSSPRTVGIPQTDFAQPHLVALLDRSGLDMCHAEVVSLVRQTLSERSQASQVSEASRAQSPWRCSAGEEDVALPNLVAFSVFAADWFLRSALQTYGRRTLIAQGLVSTLNFWATWLDCLSRLVGASLHPSDRALASRLYAFMSQSPTGQLGSWFYRLEVSNFLRALGDVVTSPDRYEMVELCWTGVEPMSLLEQRRHQMHVLDLLWWVIFVEPIISRLTDLIRSRPPSRRSATFSGLLTRPTYDQRRVGICRLALLVEIVRRFDEGWPSQVFCLFRLPWLLRFVYVDLPRHLHTRTITLNTIRLVATTLTDPSSTYRHQLDDAAREWRRLDPVDPNFASRHRCTPAAWPSLLDASMSPLYGGLLGLDESPLSASITSTSSLPTNASTIALVMAMEIIVRAGYWSVHHPAHERSPLDAAVRRYVEAYLQPSVSAFVRDKFQPYRAEGPSFARARPLFIPVPTQSLEQGRLGLSRYCAARSFAWGKPEILEHVALCSSDAAFFQIGRMDGFKRGFWVNSVYGEHRWNVIDHVKVEEAWPTLIDALQNLLCLGGPPAPSGPVPFACVLRSFGQVSPRPRFQNVARVIRLQPSGLIP